MSCTLDSFSLKNWSFEFIFAFEVKYNLNINAEYFPLNQVFDYEIPPTPSPFNILEEGKYKNNYFQYPLYVELLKHNRERLSKTIDLHIFTKQTIAEDYFFSNEKK